VNKLTAAIGLLPLPTRQRILRDNAAALYRLRAE
jgi:hypothetical protein